MKTGVLVFSSLWEEFCPEHHTVFKAFYIFTDVPRFVTTL